MTKIAIPIALVIRWRSRYDMVEGMMESETVL